jgi:hypothetical protein
MAEKLICGCGGEIKYAEAVSIYWFECKQCGFFLTLRKFNPPKIISLSDALAAFRLATRAYVKLGVQWIPVKDRLPEKKRGIYLTYSRPANILTNDIGLTINLWSDDKAKWEWSFNKGYITHWAEINLPDKE